jgi:hypothetical protein
VRDLAFGSASSADMFATKADDTKKANFIWLMVTDFMIYDNAELSSYGNRGAAGWFQPSRKLLGLDFTSLSFFLLWIFGHSEDDLHDVKINVLIPWWKRYHSHQSSLSSLSSPILPLPVSTCIREHNSNYDVMLLLSC